MHERHPASKMQITDLRQAKSRKGRGQTAKFKMDLGHIQPRGLDPFGIERPRPDSHAESRHQFQKIAPRKATSVLHVFICHHSSRKIFMEYKAAPAGPA